MALQILSQIGKFNAFAIDLSVYPCDITYNIKEIGKMVNGTMIIKPVVPSNYYSEDVPLENFWVADIVDKKKITGVIRVLNQTMPLEEYTHLKRVNGHIMKILIAPCMSNLNLQDIKNIEGLSSNLTCFSVPKYSSDNRSQYLKANRIWPSIYCENKKINNQFNAIHSLLENQDTQLKPYISQVLDIAIEAGKLCNEPVGALIIDPTNLQILAMSGDTRHTSNPLHHSVMNCIQMIANSQASGNNSGGKRSLVKQNSNYKDCDTSTPYLCTNYHIFITREPCLMCSMALVHARIKRVYYLESSPNGALGTNLLLHTLKSLNHNFEVFHINLSNKNSDI